MTTATFHPSRRTDPHRTARAARAATWWGAAAIVMAVATVALVGGIVTAPAVQTWYADLARPAWTPPNWVFAPVWGTLYAMMAAAAVLVWARRDRSEICCPLGAFAIQLGLNLAWPLLFFGLRSPLLGFLDICLLWIAVAVTATQFFLVSRVAGWLLAPYWAWVTFAAVLNAAIILHGA